jgi:excisionase family DNA binding protein
MVSEMEFRDFNFFPLQCNFLLKPFHFISTLSLLLLRLSTLQKGGSMKGVTRLLTVEEAADRLGLKPCTIRRKILERQIDYVKAGRAVRIPIEVIERIIANGYRHAIPKQPQG